MKPFYILLLTIVAAATANAQTTYTWDGSAGTSFTDQNNWTPARTTPAATDILQFNTGGTISATGVSSQTIGKLIVSNNSTVTLSGATFTNTLTIGNGTGDDLVISSGTLIQNSSLENLVLSASATADISGTYRNNGAFNISAGSIVVSVNGNLDNRGTITGATTATVLVKNGGTYFHGVNGGTVPTITWEDGSTLNLSGMTDTYPAGMGQTFKHVTFSGTLSGLTTMNSNLSCQNLTYSTSGSSLRLTNDATDRTITVAGNYSQTTGSLVLVSDDGDGTLNVTGNLSLSGGTLMGKEDNGAARINVTGNYTQSGGTLDLWSATNVADAIITVTGDFSISAGTFDLSGTNGATGRLNLAGDFSATAGTITETGTGASNGVITFNGTEPQVYTSGGSVNNTVNFAVNSGAILQMSAAGTIVSGASFTLNSGATLGIRSSVGITAAGTASGNIQTTARTFNVGAHYLYNGTVNQTTLGTGYPTALTGSLTIDNAANVTMTVTRSIANGGTVYLTNGAFAAATNLTMSSTSTIVRSGGTMTGTLQGAGLYNVVYNGNSKTSGPELSGAGLSGMTINVATNEVVTLDQARTMAGALTLTNGFLTTNSTNLLTIGTGGSASAGSNASFVNGPLAKNSNSVASFTFPVGVIGNGIRPIGFTTTTTNATTFTATFNAGSPKTAYAGATFAAGINQISNCEYWILNRSGATPSPATVTLSWSANSCNGAGYVGNPVTLKVARHDGGTPGVWTDAGYSASTGVAPYASGTVTSGVLNTFSPFTIGTGNSAQNPLPVMFADVMAYSKNAGVQVEWSNLTEREITGYIVERSSNGTNFTEIDRKAPRSNTDGKESYSYFDASPFNGANFYRIRVNEMHGKVIYSKVLKVDIGSSKQSFGLYPNPVTGRQFTVSLNGMSQGQYSLKVVNAIGQPVFETKINNQGSATTQTLELPASVKSGVYTSILTGADYRETKMFIVQ